MTAFRVVIVGGGPGGLALANALEQAEIDFVLLERRREVLSDDGAGLVIWPHNMRVLDQFGLMDKAIEYGTNVYFRHNVDHNNNIMESNQVFREFEVQHGHPFMMFPRRKLTKMLYDNIRQKEKLIPGKAVTAIQTETNGVVVMCEDGTSFEGAMVIGCDGVYSTVRELMAPEAKKKNAPFKAYYQAITGRMRLLPSLTPQHCWEKRFGLGEAMQIFVCKDEAYFTVFRRLAQPKPAERGAYTPADADAIAAEWRDRQVTPDLTFGQVWDAREWCRLVDLEEGSVGAASAGRVVLLGDAAHKMTPNAGLNLNTGWQGIVRLVNPLRALVRGNPAPATAELEAVFRDYLEAHKAHVKQTSAMSFLYSRLVTWQNGLLKMVDLGTPALGGETRMLMFMCVPIVRRGVVFNFLEEKNLKEGKVAWVNKGSVPVQQKQKEGKEEEKKVQAQEKVEGVVVAAA